MSVPRRRAYRGLGRGWTLTSGPAQLFIEPRPLVDKPDPDGLEITKVDRISIRIILPQLQPSPPNSAWTESVLSLHIKPPS